MQKTLKRLEDRTQGKVLQQIVYSLISTNTVIQQRTAVALTRLVREGDLRHIFVERKGIDVLINMLVDCKRPGSLQKEAAGTDHQLDFFSQLFRGCLVKPSHPG